MGEVRNLVATNVQWVLDRLSKIKNIKHIAVVVAFDDEDEDGEKMMITLQGADIPRPMEVITGLQRLSHLMLHNIEVYEEDVE